MIEIHCHHCQADHLVGPSGLRSFHRTAEGLVAYVVCPEGHHLVVSAQDFGRAHQVDGPDRNRRVRLAA